VKHGAYAIAAVVKFAEEGTSGRRPEHDAALSRFAADHAVKMVDLARRPTSAVDNWRDMITSLVLSARQELGRALDVVVDVSCLPKYYMLTLLGFCLSSGSVRSLKFFYAEGRYAP
jgi:hypothetical protein